MANKIFLRVGTWYRAGAKALPNDMEISPLINDVNAMYPDAAEPGGAVSIPDTSYATNADAVAALGVGKLYKSTTLINGSPIILLTV